MPKYPESVNGTIDGHNPHLLFFHLMGFFLSVPHDDCMYVPGGIGVILVIFMITVSMSSVFVVGLPSSGWGGVCERVFLLYVLREQHLYHEKYDAHVFFFLLISFFNSPTWLRQFESRFTQLDMMRFRQS